MLPATAEDEVEALEEVDELEEVIARAITAKDVEGRVTEDAPATAAEAIVEAWPVILLGYVNNSKYCNCGN